MVDAVDTKVIRSGGRYHVVHLQNTSDGTGESGVTKVDISGLTTTDGKVCTYTVIDRIEYDISGMLVTLTWDHTTPDEIATLAGSGALDWSSVGGNVDPQSGGETGDIKLTTTGHTANDSYDITLYIRKKA